MAVPVYGVAYDIAGRACAAGPRWWEVAASAAAVALTDSLTSLFGSAAVAEANFYLMVLPPK